MKDLTSGHLRSTWPCALSTSRSSQLTCVLYPRDSVTSGRLVSLPELNLGTNTSVLL